MPGGSIQIAKSNITNIPSIGNPMKSLFGAVQSKYTNYAMQKFRIDFNGSRTLRLTDESTFTFKIPTYADMLMDSYVSIQLPTIWSPIIPPVISEETLNNNSGRWIPYEFKWIENLGAEMISNISISCCNQPIQEFSGKYILSAAQRDLSEGKKRLFDEMTGNVAELNDPGNSGARVNTYPNAIYTSNETGAEPSIRRRTLYIPLNAWFQYKSQMAFPISALNAGEELVINITIRPIRELFQIRDVYDLSNNYPYIAPNFNEYYMQFHRFLQTPPDINLGIDSYLDTRNVWDADVHLICNYGFLSPTESNLIKTKKQTYMIKKITEKNFDNISGPSKIKLNTLGQLQSYMFIFNRSDCKLRNEWSNYTNWPYNHIPYDIYPIPGAITTENVGELCFQLGELKYLTPGVNMDGRSTGWCMTGDYAQENNKNILKSMAILFDGEYRENSFPVGIYNYLEKYTRSSNGGNMNGVLFYNFTMDTNELKNMGSIDMDKFDNIELEIDVVTPPLDPNAVVYTVCDPETGEVVATNKQIWTIYEYSFDLTAIEESLITIVVENGMTRIVNI